MDKVPGDKWCRKDLELVLSQFYWWCLLLGLPGHWIRQQSMEVKPLPTAERDWPRNHWNKLSIHKAGGDMGSICVYRGRTVNIWLFSTFKMPWLLTNAPGDWKEAKPMYTLNKKSKGEDPGNCRPVSLILAPRKILGQMHRQKKFSKGRVTVSCVTWNELEDCIHDLI